MKVLNRALKIQIRLTIALGGLSLLAGILSHLALTDIYHGEADVSLEWNVLRACAVIFLLFLGSALLTLTRALRFLTSVERSSSPT